MSVSIKNSVSLQVLISVRDVSEAAEALAGGAHILDVKEPSRGPLGAADEATLRAISNYVRGRVRLTAALGELLQLAALPDLSGFWAGKVGLAGCAAAPNWPEIFERWFRQLQANRLTRNAERVDGVAQRSALATGQHGTSGESTILVPVAYADWVEAKAPSPQVVFQIASTRNWPAILVDTWRKDGPCLFDHLAPDFLMVWSRRLRQAGVILGLAGSLRAEHAQVVHAIAPAVVAFRGAACNAGSRQQRVGQGQVRELVNNFSPAPCSSNLA
ncbi:MAG: (5-formylfuran-3-yl)methyl phosphate synthase [Gemmatales bacterium]|nr:(5-formylfuran-3-yl)methyl phosphate synthase [Gemmatales bacterium]